VVTKKTAEVKH